MNVLTPLLAITIGIDPNVGNAFGLLITWYSVGLVGKNHDLSATSLPISMAWMYVPMVLAGIATAIQGGAELVQAFDRLRTRSVATASEPR